METDEEGEHMKKKGYQVVIAILAVVAVALAAGNVYFLTRQDKVGYQIAMAYSVSEGGLLTTVELDHAQAEAVLLGLFMADPVEEEELPQRDPDGTVKFTQSQYGTTYEIAQVWLEGDDVWLKTPDQACKRVRDTEAEMKQVLQKQYEEVTQPHKGT